MKNYFPVTFSNVDFEGGFWREKQQLNRKTTIFAVYDRFKETGRFDAFKFSEEYEKEKRPHIFWDSDVAKWLESAAYIIEKEPDEKLKRIIDETVDLIEKNQDENGYFNIYFTVIEPENRFVNRDAHELYCAGHLIEAAVAYYNATGSDKFLKCMCKYADHIEQVFVKENSAEFSTPGHEELELALIKLYRCTGEKRYLELSGHFVERRGREERDNQLNWCKPAYNQSHLPVREQKTAEGHSVRAVYLYSAMADLAKETGDESLLSACREIFKNIAYKRMYITGGIGSTSHGEAFTVDYDLPNKSAYAETCAAIGLALFARRMYCMEADSIYADIAEYAIYNGFLSGMSLDGKAFFYENPLEIDPALHGVDVSMNTAKTRYPITQRVEVFDCSCCPPNVTRFIASYGDFLYTHNENEFLVHQYAESKASFGGVSVSQKTDYPLNGQISFNVKGAKGKRAGFRIPRWSRGFELLADGTRATPKIEKGYAYIDICSDESSILLSLEMEPVFMECSPEVQENSGRFALMRGPLVYCLEAIDNGRLLRSLAADENLQGLQLHCDNELSGYAIEVNGWRRKDFGTLYAPAENRWQEQTLRFIPYYAFANRGESEMLVWVQIV